MAFLGIGGRDKKHNVAKELSVTPNGTLETQVVNGQEFIGEHILKENNVDKVSKKLGLQVVNTPIKNLEGIGAMTQYHYDTVGGGKYMYRFGSMSGAANGSNRAYNLETGTVTPLDNPSLPTHGFPRAMVKDRGDGSSTLYVLYEKGVVGFRKQDNQFIATYTSSDSFRGIATTANGKVALLKNSSKTIVVLDSQLNQEKEINASTANNLSEITNGVGNTILLRESGGNVHVLDIPSGQITVTGAGTARVNPVYTGRSIYVHKIKADGDFTELSVQRLSTTDLSVMSESNTLAFSWATIGNGTIRKVVFNEQGELLLLYAPANDGGVPSVNNGRLIKLDRDMRLIPIVERPDEGEAIMGAGFDGNRIHMAIGNDGTQGRIITVTKDLQLMGYVENDNSGILSVETTGGSGSTGGNATIVEHADKVSIMPVSDQFYLEETWGNVSANNSRTVLNTTDPCIINKLTFFATNKESRITIRLRDSTGSLQNTVKLPALFIHNASGGGLAVTAENLKNAGSETDSWKEFIYDEDSGRFALALKDKLYAPTGLEITVEARGNTNSQIGCIGQVLYFDK